MKSTLEKQNMDSTALCYTNTIFSKLLKNEKSLKVCVDEQGPAEVKEFYAPTLESLRAQFELPGADEGQVSPLRSDDCALRLLRSRTE